MSKVSVTVDKLIIPTYPEPPAEEMPMFAENRVHLRTSGRPYPNKVVMQVDRSRKLDKEYTVVCLENDYVKIEILPEIGGRIYSALDKTTGYDFFYKQHVIKPALIGVLGSWISGGVEFNWPFHHRASGFMPCDFKVEELEDGTAICWLSEHDPIDRMKGMVGIVLRPGESRFETRMRLYNRTAVPHSFLWWENAAVPVNESYQIFFPQDVTYVNFHYLKSRTTFPIAGNGVFNGIPMDTDRDISWHKNTREATSYFASASDYDFFGGYDHGKECGVVHIGDHHISPGKKMFTWAYNQLAKSWENALTDTDGQYAELMAGSYSDNQPNFSWLEPYETKQFSQYWYPISKTGAPTFANLNCAFRIERGEENILKIQATKRFTGAVVKVYSDDKVYLEQNCDLSPEACLNLKLGEIAEYVTVSISVNGKSIAEYTEKQFDKFNMPDVITDMPSAAGMNSADELYLAGVHVDQYRDPAALPDAYWKEALKRNINHIPSLIAMARYEYNRYDMEAALGYIERAAKQISIYNERPQSGEVYYVYGQILETMGNYDKAYDFYYKATWAADCVSKGMTRIALIDIRRGDYENAVRHAENALDYGRNNSLAAAALVIALEETGHVESAMKVAEEQLKKDSLDHMMRFITDAEDLYEKMDSDAVQTCLDVAFDLASMGRYADIVKLLNGLVTERPDCRRKPVLYVLGYFAGLTTDDNSAEVADNWYHQATAAELGPCYPVRFEEIAVLEDVIARTGDAEAKMLLGCLYYNKLHYEKAAELWEQCGENYIAKRNLAVAYFSHLNRAAEALEIMKQLVAERPEDQELVYETVTLMDKMGISPEEKAELIISHTITRDDIMTELAKAYNQMNEPDKAIETLMSHEFVPCEGGEHAIADQYMFAYLVKGKMAMEQGKTEEALEYFRGGQILPQNLGAGIWNHCKRVPLKYHEALCLEKLGCTEDAEKIYRYIVGIQIEYFSNMHLKELPYYQAKSYDRLGENLKGQHLITRYLREWKAIKDTKDNGYFGTTPFFIPFVDEPARLRRSQYLYLMALCNDYMGQKDEAKVMMEESSQLNTDSLFALYFKEYGFLK